MLPSPQPASEEASHLQMLPLFQLRTATSANTLTSTGEVESPFVYSFIYGMKGEMTLVHTNRKLQGGDLSN